MPTLNAYKNDSGYYIRAWTSELGNINYKLHHGGNKIIDEIGLSDGDDISWDTIRTLRAAGELYTEQSGTLSAEDVIPPDGSAKSLSTEEAKELLQAVLNSGNLSQEQIAEISEILGIEPPDTSEARLEEAIENTLSEAGIERLQTQATLNGDTEKSTLSVDVQDVRSDEETAHLFRIGIFLLGDTNLEKPGMARHDVVVCQEHGLEVWDYAVSGEKTWEKHAEMAQQKSRLMPDLVEWLVGSGVNIGTPDEDFFTEMKGML